MRRSKVTVALGEEIADHYLIRVPGWSERRYFRDAPEDRIFEFADGEVIVHSPAGIEHQDIVAFLTFLLRGFVASRGGGKVLNGPAVLRLRPDLDKEPDIFYLGPKRHSQVLTSYVKGPADLVIEVASESTRAYDVGEKARAYEENGVAEYWVVDPAAREVGVHRRRGKVFESSRHARGKIESSALAGFWIDAAWLWQDPRPPEPDALARVLGR